MYNNPLYVLRNIESTEYKAILKAVWAKKNPRVIDKSSLNKKGTKELLGYLKRLQQCEESLGLSDMDMNEDPIDDEIIYFKQSDKWKTAYHDVKTILSGREYIEK